MTDQVTATLLDDVIRAEIKAVIQYAVKNRMPLARVQAVATGLEMPPGDVYSHVVRFGNGWRCVYTVEEQPKIGWCKHLSVTAGSLPPDHEQLCELMREFGFKAPTPETADHVWPDDPVTISVLEQEGQ